MHSDAFFSIGSTHTVCEDYALAGMLDEIQPYAILSDGCSSSLHSDIGARLLVHAAKGRLNTAPDSQLAEIVQDTAFASRVLSIPDSCLDATLLFAFLEGASIRVTVIGDGVIAAKTDKGTIVHSIEFPSEMPGYLSYLLNPQLLEKFKTEFGVRRSVLYRNREEVSTLTEHVNTSYGYTTYFGLEGLESVFIFSDGVRSFRKALYEEPRAVQVPMLDVIEQIINVKSPAGSFLERRGRAFTKWCEAEGWDHYDDFSVAGIWVGR